MLILQEIDNEANARRWMDNPDVATEWMAHAGVGVYPPLFVGEFASHGARRRGGLRAPVDVCLPL